jgi:hypothetical protein
MSDIVENIQERHGMFRNVPRFLRRAIERRLANLEADPVRFDREALESHAKLKRLHALLHIKPGERARATLFGKPPTGSLRAVLRQLTQTSDPQAAAELVRRHRLPYLLVEAALGGMPLPVAVALIEVLDAEELLARIPLLARRGLIKDEVHLALHRRLAALAADPSQRFPYQKIESVVRQAGFDRPLAETAFQLVGSPQAGNLRGHTALLVDASGSMMTPGGCLELAAEVAWRVDQALEADAELVFHLFDVRAQPFGLRRRSGLDQWRSALTVTTSPAAGTSVGAAVERLAADRRLVSRLVIVTDGYENRPPRLASALERYRAALGRRPVIHLVQPAGTARQLAIDLRNANIPFSVFTVDRHRLGLAALVPALTAQADEDLVNQILAFR